MKSICVRDLAEWLERLTATTEVVTVMGSITASSDTQRDDRCSSDEKSNKNEIEIDRR